MPYIKFDYRKTREDSETDIHTYLATGVAPLPRTLLSNKNTLFNKWYWAIWL